MPRFTSHSPAYKKHVVEKRAKQNDCCAFCCTEDHPHAFGALEHDRCDKKFQRDIDRIFTDSKDAEERQRLNLTRDHGMEVARHGHTAERAQSLTWLLVVSMVINVGLLVLSVWGWMR